VAAATTALTAVLTSCSASGTTPLTLPTVARTTASPSAPGSPTGSASTSAGTSAPSSAPASAAGTQLLAQVIPLPAGAHEWTDQSGVLDLTGFVHGFFASDAWTEEMSRGQRRGFVTAARRAWRTTDGSQADVFLVQFGSANGAQSLYDGLSSGWKDDTSKGSVFNDAADQAVGRTISTLDKLGNARTSLMTVRGNTVVYLSYFTAATPDQTSAQALFHSQLDALGHPAQAGA
jgi:hypothetical protein